jgi:hypothetical protein
MGVSQAICTIVAKNYAAQARTLCESVKSQHPSLACYALIIDDWAGYLSPAEEPFAIVSCDELGIPDLRTMQFKYNVVEYATAVKPVLIEHLLKHAGVERLLYLDPDILVTNSLDGLFQRLDDFDCVITPHLDADYAPDGLLPDDSTILLHGIYNLGFLGMRREAASKPFLAWWRNKLSSSCVREPDRGHYVDQRCIDLAVSLFEGFYIERDTGYNVAYWNLHSRYLDFDGQSWTCNGRPLGFFHFSGFNPEQPDMISPFTTRHTLATRPDLVTLFSDYGRRLVANGYYETRVWPYSFARFDNGVPISAPDRQRYRTAIAKGMQTSDPFNFLEFQRVARKVKFDKRKRSRVLNKLLARVPWPRLKSA